MGKSMNVGNVKNIMFRLYHDVDTINMVKSYDWYVWKINGEWKDIGELSEYYLDCADMGNVYPYTTIVERIKTRDYGMKELI